MIKFPLLILLQVISLFFLYSKPSFSQYELIEETKVTLNKKTDFNIKTVRNYLSIANKYIDRGNLKDAIDKLKMARIISTLLSGYYNDIDSSFRGIDVLIPREMNLKSREAILLLSKINLKLATIHRNQGEPELAVPLLVEVLRIMSPVKKEGVMAYKALLEIGFIDTPYPAGRNLLE